MLKREARGGLCQIFDSLRASLGSSAVVRTPRLCARVPRALCDEECWTDACHIDCTWFRQATYRFPCQIGDRVSKPLDQVLAASSGSAASEQLLYNVHRASRLCTLAWLTAFALAVTLHPSWLGGRDTVNRYWAAYPVLIDRYDLITYGPDLEWTNGL